MGDGFLRSGQDRVGQLDRRIGTALAQLSQHGQQQVLGKRGIDHQPQLGLPTPVQRASQLLQPLELVDRGTAAAQQLPARVREFRLATANLQQAHAEALLQPGHRVAHGRLAAVQVGRGLREPALVDYGSQGSPLVGRGMQRNHGYINLFD